jgi:hypothetical protein
LNLLQRKLSWPFLQLSNGILPTPMPHLEIGIGKGSREKQEGARQNTLRFYQPTISQESKKRGGPKSRPVMEAP